MMAICKKEINYVFTLSFVGIYFLILKICFRSIGIFDSGVGHVNRSI